MGKQYKSLTSDQIAFIKEQKIFFVASCSGSEVNISPKGYDCLKILDEKSAIYLDYPGSGDRTARDITAGGEVTIMFTSFTKKAWIVRLFCKGTLIEKDDERFPGQLTHFDIDNPAAVRRLVLYGIYAVESSCGESVPFYEFAGERESLRKWANKMGKKGKVEKYVADHREPPEL